MHSRHPDEGVFVTAQQLAAAPDDVRRWLLALQQATPGDTSDMVFEQVGAQTSGDGLAILSPAETRELLALVGNDYLACQVLFALGCEYVDPTTNEHRPRLLHFDDFFSRTDIRHSGELERCLASIDAALRRVRKDRNASLHRLEQHGGIHVHSTTQHVIYQAWRDLAQLHARDAAGPAAARSDAA